MITLKDIASKFDAHLKDVKFYNDVTADILYSPYVLNKAMALPPNYERLARIITYGHFKKEYYKRFPEKQEDKKIK